MIDKHFSFHFGWFFSVFLSFLSVAVNRHFTSVVLSSFHLFCNFRIAPITHIRLTSIYFTKINRNEIQYTSRLPFSNLPRRLGNQKLQVKQLSEYRTA